MMTETYIHDVARVEVGPVEILANSHAPGRFFAVRTIRIIGNDGNEYVVRAFSNADLPVAVDDRVVDLTGRETVELKDEPNKGCALYQGVDDTGA